jgi:hypothetical protein
MPAFASALRFSSLLLAAPLALAACNIAETGENGVAHFVPDDCGRDVCSFDDPIAAGSTVDVYLTGVDDQYVGDLEVASTDPGVIDVLGRVPDSSPRFTLLANRPGRADVAAVDRDGDEVDYIQVEVERVDELVFDVVSVGLGEPETIVTSDGVRMSRYRLDVGAHVDIDVHPYARGNWAMGAFEYGVVIDPVIAAAILPSSKVSHGDLDFYAPRGEHDIMVSAPGGAYALLRLSVE